MEIYNKEFLSSFIEVDRTVRDIMNLLRSKAIEDFQDAEFRVNFMLREILNNAVEHGNQFDFDKKVCITIFHEPGLLTFVVKDEGDGIDPLNQEIEKFVLRERNRGFEIIKSFDFEIKMVENKVIITLDLSVIKGGSL